MAAATDVQPSAYADAVVALPLDGLGLLPVVPSSGGAPFDGAPAARMARDLIAEADRRIGEALSAAAGAALDVLDRWVSDRFGPEQVCVAFHGPRGRDATTRAWFVGERRSWRLDTFADCPLVPDVHATLASVASKSQGADLSGPLLAVPKLHLFATLVWDPRSPDPRILDALRVAGVPGQSGRLSGLTETEWGWLDAAERVAPEAFTFDRSHFA